METETLDKLYLEWSQFTKARTAREIHLLDVIQCAYEHLQSLNPDGASRLLSKVLASNA